MSEQTPNDNGFDPTKITAIRMMGEDDRSDEFKEERGKLVDSVNDWLAEMAAKRDALEPINGVTIIYQPRLSSTSVGSEQLRSAKQGISLTGDGKEKPFVLQAAWTDVIDGVQVVEVQGSDPLALEFNDGELKYDGSQHEVVAKFRVDTGFGEPRGRYFSYSVNADGSIYTSHSDEQTGGSAGANLYNVADVQMAQAAFDQVREHF